MAFQDFFKGNKLALSDFSQAEITDLSNLCNSFYDFFQPDPARTILNERPTNWKIHKSQLYICYVATKGINHPAFAKIASLNRIVSGLLFYAWNTDLEWDANQPVLDSDTIFIKSKIDAINTIIATKTFSYLDFDIFTKHTDIKNQVEDINNNLVLSTFKYKSMVVSDKSDGLSSVGLNDIVSPLLSLINTTFTAAAPYTLLFQGLVLAIDDFSKPSATQIAQNRLAEYTRLNIKITELTNEMVSYQTRINTDVYDYDFVNCEVIPYVKKEVQSPNVPNNPTTPINSANVLGIDFTKPSTWFVISLIVVVVLILIRNRNMS
jgi:hypothetical protein